MTRSNLSETLARMSMLAATSVVARGRIASTALNAALLRRLSALPGEADSFLADPIFEAARTWMPAHDTLDRLSGGLLDPKLVSALDRAEKERMPRDRHPYSHQLEAWKAAREGLSCVVSSGTGSGKTECFMIPILDDLLRDPKPGLLAGVRAILIYPLNALIESQRSRLSAWTNEFGDRIRFALYNGLTPETPREVDRGGMTSAEVGDRRSIRRSPPPILVTNVTMLEYLLLRTQDRPILELSQGLLRWIVLDEAHTYIGAQAAEMALLLRRVRAAFGVTPDRVRLIATSATISEGRRTQDKLRRFGTDLAGSNADRVRVIEGRTTEPELPQAGADTPLDTNRLVDLDPPELWNHLASHPRIQKLKRGFADGGMTLAKAAEVLFDSSSGADKTKAQNVLDAVARARDDGQGSRLLPWRAHVFHRAQGGFWVCVDPECRHRDPELASSDSDWRFGAVWLTRRDRCDCGAPVFELHVCNECGHPHLLAGQEGGIQARLVPVRSAEIDDFAVDVEPHPDPEAPPTYPTAYDSVLLAPVRAHGEKRYLRIEDGVLFDNAPPDNARWVNVSVVEDPSARNCCPDASDARLAPQRYGPPFLMGVSAPLLVRTLAAPLRSSPGRPMGGRRAISFSDSRQGTARLAAKLQQDAERNLTRAFLYHFVQEGDSLNDADRKELQKKLQVYRQYPDVFSGDDIRQTERKLAGSEQCVRWKDLVDRFAEQDELSQFATDVWRSRIQGQDFADDPKKMAGMFLFRELFRRPRVQNNVETMGLLRLSFPELEERARHKQPRPLAERDVSVESWIGLVLSAIDFVFRDSLATDLEQGWVRLVSPRGAVLGSVCPSGTPQGDRPQGGRPWPNPTPHPGNPSRLHRLVYALLGSSWESRTDRDLAEEIFLDLWSLISSTAARDVGGGAYRLDFTRNAAAARLDVGWLCPVTRRIFGYSPGGLSPYNPKMRLKRVEFPRLLHANPGGLARRLREEADEWCLKDPQIGALRKRGLWADLHDRAATYTPFIRAQEHSAQIDRHVLEHYEERFKEGRINLLNCSTTMEMGVDIPDIRLVANSNVPPSVSNYRQRIGRAGRRGEPWSFGVTFCRDLPLDRAVFGDPTRFLNSAIVAPSVNLDGARLVRRHVHAALLGAFLRNRSGDFTVRASVGQFFGAADNGGDSAAHDSAADLFVEDLRGKWARRTDLADDLSLLTRGTALEGFDVPRLAGETAKQFESLLVRWRREYAQILSRREAAQKKEVERAFDLRARRMRGEFLLAELARMGFTPSYGFPVDVVTFDHLTGHRHDKGDTITFAFGERRGGASRTMDVAIREYAPGSEVVIDGLVHRSDGVLPAWSATADSSKLEDLQQFWACRSCHEFGLERVEIETCPRCGGGDLRWVRSLRPTGFVGRRAPHTGYENLGHTPYEMPRLSAGGGEWRALPGAGVGRFRADSDGRVMTLGSGPEGKGYALCLDCGRAVAEGEEPGGALPADIKKHRPLVKSPRFKTYEGYCRGGFAKRERIQRNVRLIHDARTDVFELQLPQDEEYEAGLAVAAALREALTRRLGAEAREIGVSVSQSIGPADDSRISAFLFDRASGGAGLATRLADREWFDACMDEAVKRLSCPQKCEHGCPECVLRPDLNFGDRRLDRIGGLALAKRIHGYRAGG